MSPSFEKIMLAISADAGDCFHGDADAKVAFSNESVGRKHFDDGSITSA
jgi:hypothetical protein